MSFVLESLPYVATSAFTAIVTKWSLSYLTRVKEQRNHMTAEEKEINDFKEIILSLDKSIIEMQKSMIAEDHLSVMIIHSDVMQEISMNPIIIKENSVAIEVISSHINGSIESINKDKNKSKSCIVFLCGIKSAIELYIKYKTLPLEEYNCSSKFSEKEYARCLMKNPEQAEVYKTYCIAYHVLLYSTDSQHASSNCFITACLFLHLAGSFNSRRSFNFIQHIEENKTSRRALMAHAEAVINIINGV